MIKNTAMIYFAIEKDEVLATCMTIPLENNTLEVCKPEKADIEMKKILEPDIL